MRRRIGGERVYSITTKQSLSLCYVGSLYCTCSDRSSLCVCVTSSRGVVSKVQEQAHILHTAILLKVLLEESCSLHVHLWGGGGGGGQER